jgi:tRNA threonylcarbamoyladenosine biosynthesis protein TsaE
VTAGVLTTTSSAQTEALGARLAAGLEAGDVVLVEGDLGAGKTTLVRGAIRALGHQGRVTSPTFTLAARYEDGRVPVSHLDLYRLRTDPTHPADREDLVLLEDELGADRVVFIEWPEALGVDALGAEPTLRVVLRHAGGDRREVEVHHA